MNPILHAALFYAAACIQILGLGVAISLLTRGPCDSVLSRILLGIKAVLFVSGGIAGIFLFYLTLIWLIANA